MRSYPHDPYGVGISAPTWRDFVGTGTHWFAIGLLVGVAAVMIAPGWLTGLIILFDLVALGWSTGILNYAHSAHGKWVIIAGIALDAGLFFGAWRGLRMLSDHERLTRIGGMRARGWWI